MIGETAESTSRAAASGPARYAAVALPIAVAAAGLGYAYALFEYRCIPGDEGIVVQLAWKISEGQVPHRDYFFSVPPVSLLLLAAWFKIMGISVFAERAFVFGQAVALVVLCDALLRRYTHNLLARSVVWIFLIPVGVYAWPVPSHHWVVAIVELAATLALFKAQDASGNWRWGVAAGALTALAGFSLQDQGGYFTIGLLLLYFPWIRDRAIRRKLLRSWALGGLAIAGLFAVYLLPKVPLAELYHQWIEFPVTGGYQKVAGNEPTYWKTLSEIGNEQWWLAFGNMPWSIAGESALALLMAAIQLAVVVIFILSFVNRWQTTARIGALGALAVSFMGSCLHRYALTNLVWAAPPLILVVAWGIGRLLQHAHSGQRAAGWASGIVVIAVAVAFGIGILRMASSAATVEVAGRAGTLRAFGFSEEARVRHYVAAVEQHVPLDAPLFCTGYVGVVNFLTLRPNPTRHPQFVEFNTEEHAREIVGTLRNHPRAHVLLTLPFDMEGALGQFLLYNFRPVWRGADAILLMPQHRGSQPKRDEGGESIR